MRVWNRAVVSWHALQLSQIANGLDARIRRVTDGRVAPSVDDIPIGSGRRVRAVVLFFDIRGFTQLTSSSDPVALGRTLFMLDCVIPMMMKVLYRHVAYIEKNTGDGVMAVLGVDMSDEESANTALYAAEEMFFVLHEIVNPFLISKGIDAVQARIGIDMGSIILARIGLPTGTSRHERNSLTAVGPTANIASKIQGKAGTNEIWCGDSIRVSSNAGRQNFFIDVTPDDWDWQWSGTNIRYACWNYLRRLEDPRQTLLGSSIR